MQTDPKTNTKSYWTDIPGILNEDDELEEVELKITAHYQPVVLTKDEYGRTEDALEAYKHDIDYEDEQYTEEECDVIDSFIEEHREFLSDQFDVIK